MDISIKSSIGNVRQSNQDFSDYFENNQGFHLAVLCDGMGGHNGGDVAAQMAVNHMGYHWKQSDVDSVTSAVAWLDEQIHVENERIVQASERYKDLKGMGTTIVVAIFINYNCVIASVGDSRAYLYQENEFYQLTQDDTFINELILRGELTLEEGANHPKKNVLTQSLGVDHQLNLNIENHRFESASVLLLASDGLYEGISSEDMEKIVSQHRTSSEAMAEELTTTALNNAGQDNLTVLVAQYAESGVED